MYTTLCLEVRINGHTHGEVMHGTVQGSLSWHTLFIVPSIFVKCHADNCHGLLVFHVETTFRHM
jgi:hypothetical protein